MSRTVQRYAGCALGLGIGLALLVVPGAPPLYAKDAVKTRCPPEMALTGGVCMDRWEARLLKKGEDGALTPFPAHEVPKGGGFVAESRAGVRPQGYISRTEAAGACAAAGKRLCTVTEWYRACRGEHDTL